MELVFMKSKMKNKKIASSYVPVKTVFGVLSENYKHELCCGKKSDIVSGRISILSNDGKRVEHIHGYKCKNCGKYFIDEVNQKSFNLRYMKYQFGYVGDKVINPLKKGFDKIYIHYINNGDSLKNMHDIKSELYILNPNIGHEICNGSKASIIEYDQNFMVDDNHYIKEKVLYCQNCGRNFCYFVNDTELSRIRKYYKIIFLPEFSSFSKKVDKGLNTNDSSNLKKNLKIDDKKTNKKHLLRAYNGSNVLELDKDEQLYYFDEDEHRNICGGELKRIFMKVYGIDKTIPGYICDRCNKIFVFENMRSISMFKKKPIF